MPKSLISIWFLNDATPLTLRLAWPFEKNKSITTRQSLPWVYCNRDTSLSLLYELQTTVNQYVICIMHWSKHAKSQNLVLITTLQSTLTLHTRLAATSCSFLCWMLEVGVCHLLLLSTPELHSNFTVAQIIAASWEPRLAVRGSFLSSFLPAAFYQS